MADLIQKIKNNEELAPFLSKTCCENEVCITLDGEILEEDYVVIKVDGYYNAQKNIHKWADTPPAPDCLIVRRCVDNGFGLTIGELKNINSAGDFELENLKEKFQTCFDDFICNRFSDILFIDYKNIKLYFVSKIPIHKPERDIALTLKLLMDVRFKYNGKNYMIEPRTPHPTVKKCY